MNDHECLAAAIEEARIGRAEGGVPVGAALAVDGRLLAVGRNRRVQMGSAIRHGETDALRTRAAPVVGARTDVHHALTVRHVHGRDPALRHPARRDR